ncbi:segregation and condensation protein B [Spirochaetia bacterium]|nr:segregation and condensation protein B [Spirochaetia bacterium]GHU31064.1 segregation and condensation protein B [Spirochaetia bacterium]
MDNAALIEAILYLEPDPVDEANLGRIAHLDPEKVKQAVATLSERLSTGNSGLELVHIANGITLAPKLSYWEALKSSYGRKNDARLSRAALETLSIIAYSQPITRMEIEAIRGVAADSMIRLLLEKGLIAEVGKKDSPGKPVQFGTTKEFLTLLRIGSIRDLPKLEKQEAERFALN